jgi:hypothetical protein
MFWRLNLRSPVSVDTFTGERVGSLSTYVTEAWLDGMKLEVIRWGIGWVELMYGCIYSWSSLWLALMM